MRFYCVPKEAIDSIETDATKVVLYDRATDESHAHIGANIPAHVKKAGLNPSQVGWDFLSVALSVLAADFGSERLCSPDGWTREFVLTVSVGDEVFWNSNKALVEETLGFLSGDIWNISFVEGGYCVDLEDSQQANDANEICLLSGGLDSLVGAIDTVGAENEPFFVSQIVRGDRVIQRDIACDLGFGGNTLQTNHVVSVPSTRETSQRTRSFYFIALGLLVASALEKDTQDRLKLRVSENGFIGLNIPLTANRIGSLSTRTCHPYFFRKYQELIDNAGLHVSLENSYEHKTKGEMLRECADQDQLEGLAFRTTSCGRIGRTGNVHCGRCIPCIIRRAAIHVWGKSDTTEYKYEDLSKEDSSHLNYTDVRAILVAIEIAKEKGIEGWAGSSLNSALLGDIEPYKGMLNKGLEEVRLFFNSMGISCG